jgi:hypothetical protein
LWGLAAAAALTIAAYASMSPTGRDRILVAAAHLRDIGKPTSAKHAPPLDAREGQRLAEAVRSLSDEQGRLHTRMARIENTVVEVTGSIARVEKAVEETRQSAKPETPAVRAEATSKVSGEDITSSIDGPGALPMPRPAPTTQAGPPASEPTAKTEFGVDLGSASSIEGLRVLWNSSRQRHAALLEGLRPIMHLRERPRAAPAELRLVAGPIGNAATAARLCASITAAGAVCQPTLFDGQRLAVR